MTADATEPSSLHIGLFSDTNDYYVNVARVRFETPSTEGASAAHGSLRSEPLFVSLPRPDDILAATVEPLEPDARSPLCRKQYHYTDSYQARLNTRFKPAARERAMATSLSDTFNGGVTALAALATIGTSDPKTCAVPYAPARTIATAQANYPALAIVQGATGTVVTRVDLDDRGAIVGATVTRSSGNFQLDTEGKRASTNSRYSPETFRCQAIAGSYLFVVEFTSSR
ncbi:MAG: TonB family protein [Candidatus Eremiobacteraeota bacterium]|nr:TonB family protein [Candidatus Eremiobacteraeota bacterium]